MGVVTAFDITHDPRSGVDTYRMAEAMRKARDPRVKYVISNGRIYHFQKEPWVWRKYGGSNRHDKHVHVSVREQKKFYDDVAPWEVGPMTPVAGAPAAIKKPTLRLGSKGPDVAYLQRLLGMKEQGGTFNAETRNTVIEFQKARGLVADGVVGPYTWSALLDTGRALSWSGRHGVAKKVHRGVHAGRPRSTPRGLPHASTKRRK